MLFLNLQINKLYDQLAKLGLKEGWLFKSEGAANAAKKCFDAQKIGDLESLGILKTGMSKLYATADMAKAIKGAPGKLDGLTTIFCI
jgi:hypothetical protein